MALALAFADTAGSSGDPHNLLWIQTSGNGDASELSRHCRRHTIINHHHRHHLVNEVRLIHRRRVGGEVGIGHEEEEKARDPEHGLAGVRRRQLEVRRAVAVACNIATSCIAAPLYLQRQASHIL